MVSDNFASRPLLAWLVLGCVFVPTRGQAETYQLDFNQADKSSYLDRWMYPFNVTPGSRIQASTFGAIGSAGVDERDGQFLIAVNTDALGIPTGAGLGAYEIKAARFVLTETVGGYRYDATYDAFTTYLDASNVEPDEDVGRPIELYGVGFRNEFEQFGWPDGPTLTAAPSFSAGSEFGVSGRGTRPVFAADATGIDVSNNVDSLADGLNGFDPKPFAIGHAVDSEGTELEAGSEVDSGTQIVFDVEVSDSAIQSYFQHGLNEGQLGFAVTSLHDAGFQGAGSPYVNFATSDHFAYAGPRFEIEVVIGSIAADGDFDQNGRLEIADLDLLSGVIVDESHAPGFDLTEDSRVDQSDLDAWIHDLYGTFAGDANLDGEFNSSDLVMVFAAGEYEDSIAGNSTWATGDWLVDGEFTTNDLVTAFQDGGYEQGPRDAARPIPEPSGIFLMILGAIALTSSRQHLKIPTRFHVDIS